MEAYLKTVVDKKDLLSLSSKVIRYIIDELDECNQKMIAAAIDVSTATINGMAKGVDSQTTVSKKLIRRSLAAIIKEYQVQIDVATGNITGISYGEKLPKENDEASFFTTPYGNRWKIMVHLKYWGKIKEDVGIRYLEIKSKKKVEFLVGSERHDDYEGSFKLALAGKQVVFELVTKKQAVKEVYLRFCIGNPFARPSIMEGFLLHSSIDNNSMSGYTIVAENISGKSDELTRPRIIPFAQFEKQNPVIAKFFSDRSTAIHCHSGVYTLEELNDLNEKREKEKEMNSKRLKK
jgi:DNA-binding phage protein